MLPGSRTQEVKRMLPLLRDAMHRLAEDNPHITAVIPTPQSSVVTNMVQESLSRWEVPTVILPAASDLEKYDAFAVSVTPFLLLLLCLLVISTNWMSSSFEFIWCLERHHLVKSYVSDFL